MKSVKVKGGADMKKRAMAAAIILAFCFSAVVLNAQENEGLIPKLIKKWKGEKKTPEPVSAPKVKVPTPGSMPGVSRPPIVPAKPSVAPSTAEADRTVVTGIDKMSKEEMLKDIIDDLDSDSDILDYLPQLKKEKTPDGKNAYLFKSDTKSVPLQDLDKDTLKKILGSVRQTATRINTDRITRQLETIRQTQRVVAVPPRPAPLPPPATPSQIATPQTPRAAIPQAPSQTSASRTPTPPPQIPRR